MVVNGNVNVFNFKVLAFVICRGTDATKIDCLWDLIWGMKNAKVKNKVIKDITLFVKDKTSDTLLAEMSDGSHVLLDLDREEIVK